MKTQICFLIFLLSFIISACGDSDIRFEKKLSAIKTVEDEKSVFTDIRENWTVAFLPFDKDHERVDLDKDNWWSATHTIEFYAREKVITYQVIKSENVLLLLIE